MPRSRTEKGSRRTRKSGSFMNCLCSGERLTGNDDVNVSDSDSLATRDRKGTEKSHINLAKAESSIRETGDSNYEEARALLGRCEHRKGNIELALQVSEGIDIAAVTPKIKVTLARAVEHRKRRSQNNLEEAILLLMILLRKVSLKKIEWDPSILDHLSYAQSVSGNSRALATQFEELLPGFIDREDFYYKLALCYYGAGEDSVALDLLRKLS